MNPGGPFGRIDHVQLAIPPGGEEAAILFYGTVLGLEQLEKPPELAGRGGAWFRSGSVVVHVGIDPGFRAARKAHPAFRCTDYDGLLARLRAAEVEIVADPHPFEGKAHCYVSDPFGNRLEFIAE